MSTCSRTFRRMSKHPKIPERLHVTSKHPEISWCLDVRLNVLEFQDAIFTLPRTFRRSKVYGCRHGGRHGGAHGIQHGGRHGGQHVGEQRGRHSGEHGSRHWGGQGGQHVQNQVEVCQVSSLFFLMVQSGAETSLNWFWTTCSQRSEDPLVRRNICKKQPLEESLVEVIFLVPGTESLCVWI